jgi:hypothetical protein
MYAFAQRKDTTVFDEPLYAHYLSKTDTEAEHPGAAEILANMEHDGQKVVDDLILGQHSTPIVLFKQMTHHLIHLDRSFIPKTKNILLIRDPRAIIKSYSKVVSNPKIWDVGIQMQYDLFKWLEGLGQVSAVIDTKYLLLNPEIVLQKLCERLDIPFDKAMLSWEAGARPEDGVWAKYWYANVHKSTGFKAYEEKTIELSEPLEVLASECQPYYDYLLQYALKA